jgi:hypothetical protein
VYLPKDLPLGRFQPPRGFTVPEGVTMPGMLDWDEESARQEQLAEEKGGRSTEGSRVENLLTMEPGKAGRRVIKDVEDQNKMVRGLSAQWKVNVLRGKGYTGVSLVKAQDEHRAYIPVGATPSGHAMNKAARLKRRLASNLFADPAVPDPLATGEDEDSQAAADFTRRLLIQTGDESGLDDHRSHRRAFDVGSDYGSGFLHYFVEPYGGGYQPVELMAAPGQRDPARATIDPRTNKEHTGDLVRMYLYEDGTMGEDRSQAVKRWLPAVGQEILNGRNIRFHPYTANDVWEAEGVSIVAMVPVGVMRDRFPESFGKLSEEAIDALVQQRPVDFKDLLPLGDRRGRGEDLHGDERLVFVVTRYQKQGAGYDLGAHLIAAGDGLLLYRGVWYDEENDYPMDIPVSQVKQYNTEEQSFGVGVMEHLGPGNEIRASVIDSFLEHLDRFRRRKVYVPVTSNLHAKQMQAEMGTHIAIAPGGEPKYEEVPDFPRFTEKLFGMVSDDLDDESGLQEAGQGLEAPNIKSGVQQQAVVTQVIIGLSDLRQNIERAFQRSWRVRLQLTRAYFDRPQRLEWVGEDGQHKEKSWVGSDVGGTMDVRIERGSFTQLAPTQKDALTFQWLEMGLIDPATATRQVMHHSGALVGAKEHPAQLKVERQIGRWREGPPQGWQPIPPQPVKDPLGLPVQEGGQPVTVPAPDPVLQGLFPPNPADEDPEVAMIRHRELARAMQDGKADRYGPEWLAPLAQAYQQARYAAGIMTVREQAEAAQAQAEAEQAAQAEAQAGAEREAQAGRQHELAKGAQQAQADIESQRTKSAEAVIKTEAQAAQRSRSDDVKAQSAALTAGKR